MGKDDDSQKTIDFYSFAWAISLLLCRSIDQGNIPAMLKRG